MWPVVLTNQITIGHCHVKHGPTIWGNHRVYLFYNIICNCNFELSTGSK